MTITEYVHEVFSGDGSPVYFNADFGREFVVAIFIFFIGWASSQRRSRGQLKSRLIDELIVTQRELYKHAYPAQWSRRDTRETWLLTPYVQRVSFVKFNLNQEDVLKPDQLKELEEYLACIEDFIAMWAETQHRSIRYDEAYERVFAALTRFLEKTAPKQVSRMDGLIDRASNSGAVTATT